MTERWLQNSRSSQQVDEEENNKEDFIILYPIKRQSHLLAVLLLLLTVIAIRWKAATGLTTYYIGGAQADAGLYYWLFRHNLHHLFSESFFDTIAFFPYPNTLAWSDNFIFPSLLAMPFWSLGIPEDALYNLILLLAHFGMGYSVFRVVALLSGDTRAALVAGFSALVLAYFATALGHPQLQFAFCFPVALEILFRALRKPFSSGIAFGLLYTAMFLTTVYFAVFLTLFPVLFFAMLFIMHPERKSRKTTIMFLLGVAPSIFLLAPFLPPYLTVKSIFGGRDILEMYAFRATGFSFLAAPPLSLLYGFTHTISHAEAYLFPGVTLLIGSLYPFFHCYNARPLYWHGRLTLFLFVLTLVLSSVATGMLSEYLVPLLMYATLSMFFTLLYKIGKFERLLNVTSITNRTLYCLTTGIVLTFLLLSLGPTGKAHEMQLSLFSLLYYTVPGYDAVRAISRAAIPALLGMTILFGLALSRMNIRHPRYRRLLPVLALLVFAENFVTNYALAPRDGAPVVAHTLSALQKPDDVTIFLPMTDEIKPNRTVKSWKNFALRNVDSMNWALDTKLRIVNGYSGQRSKIMKTLPGDTMVFPDTRSLAALSKITNLRYIIYQSKHRAHFNPIKFQAAYEYFGDTLQLIEKDGEGYYLFSFSGDTRLSERDTIRAPSFAEGGVLSFELQLPYDSKGLEQVIRVRELDHAGADIQSFTATSNGEWATFHAPLPKRVIPGLPSRLQFLSDSLHRFHIRNVMASIKEKE